MNKRHYEHTLPNIRGSLSNTYPFSLSEKNSTPSSVATAYTRPFSPASLSLFQPLASLCRINSLYCLSFCSAADDARRLNSFNPVFSV